MPDRHAVRRYTRSRSGPRRIARVASALGLALALGAAPRPAAALSAGEVGDAIFDVTVLRPLGASASLLGVVFFAVAVPFVAPARNHGVAWDQFVVYPFDYTFRRDLGDF